MGTEQVVLSPEIAASVGENGPDQALSGRSALVLYGSETGNAQDIAEDLGRTLERLRFHTSVVEMDDVGLKELLQYRLVVFVVSTTGQGEMPQNASKFWRSLLRRKLPPSCLTRLAYTCFGLGDSSYPKYNWAARKLCKRLAQLGALEFFASGEGDERHEDGIDTIYLPWKGNLRSWTLANHPLPGNIQPIPDQDPLPPRFTLFIDEGGQQSDKARSSEEPSADVLLPIPGGITATVQSNERVTPADHWQDVRLLRLDLETPPAEPLRPGATVTIYPKNSASDVDALIERMRWQDQADRPLRFHDALVAGGLCAGPADAAEYLATKVDIWQETW
ncbi:nitric oxide synthase [Magnaporthiopsis poae ATCC 64411]|uniref:Nitric oxide synthase n=1 Tax=Magnaporthiopsis poae (strain ATCC 64411 / 73-15) TaxID=644358 RepID=A0A0C4DPH4_MAGP6|nr:nitric oxide synthase [Magnaporthiopsis poae ATCC 64411]